MNQGINMNVLSLFDGMSCGRIALSRSGINVGKYYASELDDHAIKVTQNNWPDTLQLGDVTKWRDWDINWGDIDLLIGGSPCQGFSFAGKNLAFKDHRSKLFFTYVDILQHIKSLNPAVKFLMENVKMKSEHMQVVTDMLGVAPVEINSALVSAQNRVRNYWANWNFTPPDDRGIVLLDVLDLNLPDDQIGVRVREKTKCLRVGGRNSPFGDRHEWDSLYQRVSKKGLGKRNIEKSGCLTGGANSGGNHSDMDIIHTPHATRRYTVTECERLQTIPDEYTAGVSNTQRYKMLGNGWTVDVVSHIFSQMPD